MERAERRGRGQCGGETLVEMDEREEQECVEWGDFADEVEVKWREEEEGSLDEALRYITYSSLHSYSGPDVRYTYMM